MITALCLVAAALTADVRVLVLAPKLVNTRSTDVRVLQQLLVQELSRADGATIVGSADLEQLAALGASQISAGCDADACLAELGGAMGAEFVVFSEVGRLGERAIWQLGLWDQQRGEIVVRRTIEAATVARLADGVPGAVVDLVAPLQQRGVRYQRSDGPSPLFVSGVGAVAVGIALAVVGGAGVAAGIVVVADDRYSTDLRRSLQAAGPALVVTAIAGVAIGLVGGGLLVADAVVER